MTDLNAVARCPVCPGPFLYGFTIRHTLVCDLGIADDGTHAADVERLDHRLNNGYERPSTMVELALATVLGWTATAGRAPMTRVRSVTPQHHAPGRRRHRPGRADYRATDNSMGTDAVMATTTTATPIGHRLGDAAAGQELPPAGDLPTPIAPHTCP